jgi:glucose-1-phosphate adenylyltransferase
VVDSVLFHDVVVESDATVITTVVDEASVIGRGATVGAEPAGDSAEDDEVVLVGQECRIGAGTTVPAGGRLEPGTTT